MKSEAESVSAAVMQAHGANYGPMLQLLGVPTWRMSDGLSPSGSALPASLPACLLIYLACQGRWLDRDHLATLFWPERSHEEARHNLRVNLHRVRQLLIEWGLGAALQSERSRIRLEIPTDVAALRAAVGSADGSALAQLAPEPWLSGFRIAGFASFFEWAQQFAQQLGSEWRSAAEQVLATTACATTPPPWRDALHKQLQTLARSPTAVGPDTESDAKPDHPVQALNALVGRNAPLQSLRQTQYRAVVLTGEAGMGKTALLLAAFGQAPMLHGREGLTQIPYRPVVEYLQANMPALRARLRDSEDDLGAYRMDLARLLPQLAPKEPLPPLDMHTAKARLLEALARVFEAWSPWLLVDDLQWCDAATLEFLTLLTHRGAVRWRAGARAYELTQPQRDWLANLERSGHLHLLVLQGLAPHAVEQLCQQLRPDQIWQPAQVQRLLAQSDGNPFALHELLKSDRHTGSKSDPSSDRRSAPVPVRDMLQRRLQAMAAEARALVEAAAVLVRPMPLGVLAQVADVDAGAQLGAMRLALQSDLLREDGLGLQCRHDLVRHAVMASLGPTHAQALHRKAALALAARAEGDAEPLAVAGHWSAAQEPQTALAWMFRGAEQLKRRGRFDEARQLWKRVADESLDATQTLQARLALAECELLTDLAGGRRALEMILEQAPAVAEVLQREHIEAQALSGLVDNMVFSGDMAAARGCAQRLRPLLPKLRTEDRIHATEVLIELAMREPDIAGAWSLLDQVRRLAPNRPSTLSFEAQIHWFSGNVLAARDAFESLLADHADYCSGLTIENDLAVMCHALGDLGRAETMARRSLVSWAGVAHTEALSFLVLGAVLTSAGRHAQAFEVLDQAEQLGVDQGSRLFVAEAQVRRAKLRVQCGQYAAALDDLDSANITLHDSTDPLRVSQYAVTRLVCQIAMGQEPERALVQRVQALVPCSSHPLLLARLARMEAALALTDGNLAGLAQAGQRQADIARAAGLMEPLVEALLLQACAATHQSSRVPLLQEAADLADMQGFADLAWRAHGGLEGSIQPSAFDATQARQRAPWLA